MVRAIRVSVNLQSSRSAKAQTGTIGQRHRFDGHAELDAVFGPPRAPVQGVRQELKRDLTGVFRRAGWRRP